MPPQSAGSWSWPIWQVYQLLVKYKDNKITKYNFACLVLYRLQPGFLPCSPPALLSWDGWANSLPRPTCCYHEWKAVVETKVNGHWNKLTILSTLWSGSILMLYLVQNSIYNLVSLPGLAWPGLAREENVWAVFSGPPEAGGVPSRAHDRKSQFSSSGPGFFYDDWRFFPTIMTTSCERAN